MSAVTLQLTARDPIVARDGRPFGAGQGNRMRGLGWPLPSVVAGSLRTALVKANAALDFASDMPQQLMEIAVAGVFPTAKAENGVELYLPAPNDCIWDEKTNRVHRAQPIPLEQGEGVDFPDGASRLAPVRLTTKQAEADFKPKLAPAWWPLTKYEKWLKAAPDERSGDWFEQDFLNAAIPETRDHVRLDAGRGAAAEGELFTTVGLNLAHLPRFRNRPTQTKLTFDQRFAEIGLSARVTWESPRFAPLEHLNTWHPLGGERRLVHWQRTDANKLWERPVAVRDALAKATHIRMVLATPAIFSEGWKPGWLNGQLEGSPPGANVKLKLVGISNARWKAVSGWSLAPPRGPKPIRRMVPAGSVYFFSCTLGDAAELADCCWLQSVSDEEPEPTQRTFASARADGFGLAVWGTWKPHE